MVKAFLFGKFLPFHKGHKAMMDFALGKCDFLTVLVCCSDMENIPCWVRRSWIEKTYEGEERIAVKTYHYKECELPNTSATSWDVSVAWSEVFKTLFPSYSMVVTSEEYGYLVARIMGIEHVAFDIERNKTPISATHIRNDVFANWHFLPNSVRPYFAIKIVLLGTESTGKTTLAEKLSAFFGGNLVLEAAREIIADSNQFSMDDLNLVASEHAKRITEAILGDSPLTMIDTNIYTTLSYAKFMFGKNLNTSDDIMEANKAALYLYLTNDVAHIQDGTRLSKQERDLLDISHRQILADHHIEFTEIAGDWEDRFRMARLAIEQFLQTHRS